MLKAKVNNGVGEAQADVTVESAKGKAIKLIYSIGLLKVGTFDEAGRPMSSSSITLYKKDGTDEFGKPKLTEVAIGRYTDKKLFKVPPGDYVVKAKVNNGVGEAQADVTIEPSKGKEIKLIYSIGLLKVGTFDETGKPMSASSIALYKKDGTDEFGKPNLIEVAIGRYTNKKLFRVPPGEYIVKALNKKARAKTKVTIEASKGKELKLVLKEQALKESVPSLDNKAHESIPEKAKKPVIEVDKTESDKKPEQTAPEPRKVEKNKEAETSQNKDKAKSQAAIFKESVVASLPLIKQAKSCYQEANSLDQAKACEKFESQATEKSQIILQKAFGKAVKMEPQKTHTQWDAGIKKTVVKNADNDIRQMELSIKCIDRGATLANLKACMAKGL